MHLAQELLTNVQCSGQFKVCEGDESLEEEEHSGQPLEADNNWETSSKLILLQLHEKLPKSSVSTILWLFHIWNKLERWKSLISGCLLGLLQIKKIIILKCCLLLFYPTTNNFSIRLWHAMKSGFYTTNCDYQLSGWTEKQLQNTSQSQTGTKKRSWSLFGGLLPIWVITAFWILVKPFHLRSMLSKSMRCTENCKPAASIGQYKGPRSSWQCLTTGLTNSASEV